jgi:N-acetylglucosaminyldiphosphoundecaprenol N-acetyl-beta-D-mannosaminyltransferase
MNAPSNGGRQESSLAPQPRKLLGMRVDRTSYPEAAERIAAWARAGESRYVCCASVNNVMEAFDSSHFCEIMNAADLVTPDGMPLVWGLRLLGAGRATRVYGPDLMAAVLEAAAREELPVGFYGACQETLGRLTANARRRWPGVRIVYACAPPFRPLTAEEDAAVTRDIGQSGARVVFVGLSTPKQERWMAGHRGRIPAVMLGVGAAFDFLAGVKPQAPRWMQRSGAEWLFRLMTEPRRLAPRYLRQNPRFAALFAMQLLGVRFTRRGLL